MGQRQKPFFFPVPSHIELSWTDAPLSRNECCNPRATLLYRKDIIIATERSQFTKRTFVNDRLWRILLKKSFGGGERNFLEPLTRFVRSDVRDQVASQKNVHGPLYRRYGTS